MPVNCDLIVIFTIYGQFAAIRKADSERIVYKTYIFINNNLLKNLKHSSRTIAFCKKKCWFFAKKCWYQQK